MIRIYNATNTKDENGNYHEYTFFIVFDSRKSEIKVREEIIKPEKAMSNPHTEGLISENQYIINSYKKGQTVIANVHGHPDQEAGGGANHSVTDQETSRGGINVYAIEERVIKKNSNGRKSTIFKGGRNTNAMLRDVVKDKYGVSYEK